MNTSGKLSLDAVWYHGRFPAKFLLPLSWVFRGAVELRRFSYRAGWLKKRRLPVPVIIVGNISVGGTGKTPLIIALARLLKRNGYKPGVISRGYGGEVRDAPVKVDPLDNAATVGDEPLLLSKHSDCPVAIGVNRFEAGRLLLEQDGCDVILSDDGLQHYKLARDIEIAVVDGERQFGNGYCLPAGPLREPACRLSEVDFIIENGTKTEDERFSMTLSGDVAVNLTTGSAKPLQDFIGLNCHAVAGIGNPDRFFNKLAAAGLHCINHRFPDHYSYRADDIEFGDYPVLMTEKDAVKCFGFARDTHWYVPVTAQLEPAFTNRFLTLLREKYDGYKIT
ncbi:tetraacyldisaccharide 4'-kinase [Methylotuvimicrobium sp. KM2]|uniref:tetraacyldisaccharide 4'-kinase n=1 Tax=Methylotuvimicrobium sp. KM2 TaxID=3133976 RepID=UPI00310155B4